MIMAKPVPRYARPGVDTNQIASKNWVELLSFAALLVGIALIIAATGHADKFEDIYGDDDCAMATQNYILKHFRQFDGHLKAAAGYLIDQFGKPFRQVDSGGDIVLTYRRSAVIWRGETFTSVVVFTLRDNRVGEIVPECHASLSHDR